MRIKLFVLRRRLGIKSVRTYKYVNIRERRTKDTSHIKVIKLSFVSFMTKLVKVVYETKVYENDEVESFRKMGSW